MISVIVYTLNDAKTIAWCLESVKQQDIKSEFEVLVIDDHSSDKTPEIICEKFPEFTLIKHDQTKGWIVSLRELLSDIKGEVVAYLGAHCRAAENWLSTIENLFTEKIDAVTGTALQNKSTFWDRFHTNVMPVYFSKEKFAEFLWDDNFAVTLNLLKTKELLETDIVVSPGAGTVSLSKKLTILKIPIYFQSTMIVEHVVTTFSRLIHIWWLELPRNAVTARRVNPALPGAKLLWSGPVVAAIIAAGRFAESALRMLTSRKSRGFSIFTTSAYIILLACFMPVYFLGLCREIIFPVK